MTIKESIAQLEGAEAILLNRIFTEFNTALLMAIDALKEKEERENPQPLTIEELKQVNKQPVYVVPLDCKKKNAWMEWCVMDDEVAYVPGVDYWTWELKHYGKTWIAYRYKPKETP